MVTPGGNIGNVAAFFEPELPIPAPQFGYGTIADKSISGGVCPGGRLRLEKLAKLVKYKRVDPSKLANYVFEGFDKLSEAFDVIYKTS